MSRSLSPCIDVCAIDPESRLCRGCYRTLEEIAAWPHLTDEARLEVVASLGVRRLAAEGRRPKAGRRKR